MRLTFPGTLRTNSAGMRWLAETASHRDIASADEIVLDFINIRDMDENLCAALGVIVSQWKGQGKTVTTSITSTAEILATFNVNEFLNEVPLARAWYNFLPGLSPYRHIEGALVRDNAERINYRKFQRDDTAAQAAYVQKLVSTHWWPEMTEAVRGALTDCILEVFNNAQEHSESEHGVFVCGSVGKTGQRMMRISIADAGIGFRAKIENSLNLRMTSEQAIEWGMKEGNTVRKNTPGGLGLKLLKEFIFKNNGKLTVVSDSGYWEFSDGKVRKESLGASFPGTVVTITVDTEDPKSYRLINEPIKTKME